MKKIFTVSAVLFCAMVLTAGIASAQVKYQNGSFEIINEGCMNF